MNCSSCGCTDDDACVIQGVPCHWVEPGLCSACAPDDDLDRELPGLEAGPTRIPPIRPRRVA
jgi:hypothetical protein